MGILNELFGGLGKGVATEPRFTVADGVSEGVCRGIWARFVAFRQAGYLTPFSVRKTPYKQKIYSMGTHIIKEYTGARETVRPWVAAARAVWLLRSSGIGVCDPIMHHHALRASCAHRGFTSSLTSQLNSWMQPGEPGGSI